MRSQTLYGCIILTLIAITATEKGPVVSRFCRKQLDCGESFGYICTQNQTCQCDRFYILNNYGDKCVGGVAQKCRYDEHCVEGAFCEFQVRCQCKEEMYPSEDGLACSGSDHRSSSRSLLVAFDFVFIVVLNIILIIQA